MVNTIITYDMTFVNYKLSNVITIVIDMLTYDITYVNILAYHIFAVRFLKSISISLTKKHAFEERDTTKPHCPALSSCGYRRRQSTRGILGTEGVLVYAIYAILRLIFILVLFKISISDYFF